MKVEFPTAPPSTTTSQALVLKELSARLGRSPWGGRDKQPWAPALAPINPPRFSTRQAQQGNWELAHELKRRELFVEQLVAAHGAPSALDPRNWEFILSMTNYPPEHLRRLLIGMREGATMEPTSALRIFDLSTDRTPNRTSLYARVDIIAEKMAKQIAARTVLRWPLSAEFLPLIISPLAMAPKFERYEDEIAFSSWVRKNSGVLKRAADLDDAATRNRTPLTTEQLRAPSLPNNLIGGKAAFRIIHDAKAAINAFGEPGKLGSLDTARDVAHELEPGDWLFVCDLIGAYKLVKLIPWQLLLMGFALKGEILVDTRLTFGVNMGPYQYHAFVGHPLMWVINWLIGQTNLKGAKVYQYIDDHLGRGRSESDTWKLYKRVQLACEWLNTPMEEEKFQPPSQKPLYVGLIFDTSGPRVLVICPESKLKKIRDRLGRAAQTGSISLSLLESVLGSIAFVAVAIHGAWVFSSELRLQFYQAKARGLDFLSLDAGLREDMVFWADFAQQWNGQR